VNDFPISAFIAASFTASVEVVFELVRFTRMGERQSWYCLVIRRRENAVVAIMLQYYLEIVDNLILMTRKVRELRAGRRVTNGVSS